MGVRLGIALGLLCLWVGCGGTEFDATESDGAAATGGTAGSAGSAATGGAGAASGGSAGGGGTNGGAAGDSGVDATVDASGGTGPIEIVQTSSTQLSDDEIPVLELSNAPHAGSAIIVGITCISDFDGDCVIEPGGVTDNQSNTYTRILQSQPILSSSQAARGYIFIAENIGTPNGSFVISVDPVGTTTNQRTSWGALEVRGLASPPSLDAWGISANNTGTEQSTIVATDLATVQPNELAVALLSMRSDDTNMLITPEAGWTTQHQNQNGAEPNPPGHSMISRLTTSAGIVTHTWTHDVPTRGAVGIIATFKGAAGADP